MTRELCSAKRYLRLFALACALVVFLLGGCDEDVCSECRVVSSGYDCKSDETAGSCCCKNGGNVHFCCPDGTSGSEAAGCGFCD